MVNIRATTDVHLGNVVNEFEEWLSDGQNANSNPMDLRLFLSYLWEREYNQTQEIILDLYNNEVSEERLANLDNDLLLEFFAVARILHYSLLKKERDLESLSRVTDESYQKAVLENIDRRNEANLQLLTNLQHAYQKHYGHGYTKAIEEARNHVREYEEIFNAEWEVQIFSRQRDNDPRA